MPEKIAKIENIKVLMHDIEEALGEIKNENLEKEEWEFAENAVDCIINDARAIQRLLMELQLGPGVPSGVWSKDQIDADSHGCCKDCGEFIYKHEAGMGCPPYPLPF